MDWHETQATVSGDEQAVCVFCMRSIATGAGFHHAYLEATQQGFPEAHELALTWIGGVFARIRYNLKAAQRVVRGMQRNTIERFIAFRSQCGFDAHF